MKKVITKSLAETHAVAEELIEWLLRHPMSKEDHATVLALEGDLGAGKTAFAQGLAHALGIQEKITSPTFVLMKKYGICMDHEFPWITLSHIDAYRFEDAAEMEPLRWQELLASGDNLIALEWPERVKGVLPESIIPLHFRFIDETTREITLPYD